ncbi:MAG: type III-B CRISPR module RAMP protein Cmr4 [Desulfobacteraceae bacterium 4572_19]|nr:MAG: type III-B CRISPR module RAMP protein Cmr4 [Desulfobacteraceae bacterium 4572_19]
MFKYKNYLIETLTDTHVGSGESSAVADSTIQKDPVTNFPIFRDSSLKGAIKDHMRTYLNDLEAIDQNQLLQGSKGLKRSTFDMVFGPDAKTAAENTSQYPNEGLVRFFDARILTIPLRASKRVFYNATSPLSVMEYLDFLLRFNCITKDEEKKQIEILKQFFTNLTSLLNSDNAKDFIVFNIDINNLIIEEFENGISKSKGDEFFQELDYDELCSAANRFLAPQGSDNNILSSIAIFSDEVFSGICEAWLPVKARNCVEKGKENLFYEEVLPRRSVLWFMTGEFCHFSNDDKQWFEKGFAFFNNKLTNNLIQVGGNASTGHGVITIKENGGM